MNVRSHSSGDSEWNVPRLARTLKSLSRIQADPKVEERAIARVRAELVGSVASEKHGMTRRGVLRQLFWSATAAGVTAAAMFPWRGNGRSARSLLAVDRIRQARTLAMTAETIYVTERVEGAEVSKRMKQYFLEGGRMRGESSDGHVFISEYRDGFARSLMLLPDRRAIYMENPTNPPLDIYRLFKDLRGDSLYPMGEGELEGRKYRRIFARIDSWNDAYLFVDPETSLPVRAEIIARMPGAEIFLIAVTTDMQFDIPLDETLFSMDPPAGYQLVPSPDDPREMAPVVGD